MWFRVGEDVITLGAGGARKSRRRCPRVCSYLFRGEKFARFGGIGIIGSPLKLEFKSPHARQQRVAGDRARCLSNIVRGSRERAPLRDTGRKHSSAQVQGSSPTSGPVRDILSLFFPLPPLSPFLLARLLRRRCFFIALPCTCTRVNGLAPPLRSPTHLHACVSFSAAARGRDAEPRRRAETLSRAGHRHTSERTSQTLYQPESKREPLRVPI